MSAKKTVEELGIEINDIVLYQRKMYKVIYTKGFWVNLAPLPYEMVLAEEVEKLYLKEEDKK